VTVFDPDREWVLNARNGEQIVQQPVFWMEAQRPGRGIVVGGKTVWSAKSELVAA
jgi:dihydroorotase-like cyclic amidohydrolase